jgi:hypothetical protein
MHLYHIYICLLLTSTPKEGMDVDSKQKCLWMKVIPETRRVH